jgi:hypothetical protein
MKPYFKQKVLFNTTSTTTTKKKKANEAIKETYVRFKFIYNVLSKIKHIFKLSDQVKKRVYISNFLFLRKV